MIQTRPYVLSIAGIDPSGGAGLYADIKTFEHFRVQGLGVCTAITHQNEQSCEHVEWQSIETVTAQLRPLSHLPVRWIKIGIVPDSTFFLALLDVLKNELFPESKIIWDPILSSSSGTTFANIEHGHLDKILDQIDVFMPNWAEAQLLSGNNESMFSDWAQRCTVYLKGGHREDNKAKDVLMSGSNQQSFNAKRLSPWDKRGTGCTLSAALCANLSKEISLHRSILKSKRYLESVMNSNPSLYGWYRL
jgi:hydroxymethylpyrimidine/phosphomethylpyrimidine kinase